MQRRKFVQLSGLSVMGTFAIPSWLPARSASSQFNDDWKSFTRQKGISKSNSNLPEQVMTKLQATLPAGVDYEQGYAVYHYTTAQGKVFFTAFELKTLTTSLGQYLIPLWQQDAETSDFKLMMINGPELANLVSASVKAGLPLFPQPALNHRSQAPSITTNHGELQNKVRLQHRKCSHEWTLTQGSRVLNSGSFDRRLQNSLFWS